jgi:hypothetical protein
MSTALVACAHCRLPLPGNLCNAADAVRCPSCDRVIFADVFPAQFRDRKAGVKGEAILEDGVSSCFYHEGKKAVVPCDGCGRFLCALCDVELNQRHLCPSCVENSRARGRHINLETHRTVFDTAALTLALLPLVVFPLTLFTAPAAGVCGVMSFYRPGSVLRRRPWRALFGIVLGVGEVIAWIALFIASNE